MTPQLEKARRYEKEGERAIKTEERPALHLTPQCGWMNDPNGFSYYGNRVHLFYQYAPYQTTWGPMHWGHAVTRDFLHWEYRPCVMAPDTKADRDGCFSGTALTMPDGRQKLFYTGVTKAEELQVQCAAVGDGEDYEKLPDNPLIDASMLPDGYFHKDFRDPKVWKEEDGLYRMLVSARNAQGDGELLLFSSPDSETWEFSSVLYRGETGAGVMLECPDLFHLDGKDVLLVSPMGGSPYACIGTVDPKTWEFQVESRQQLDLGPDFYAPQTMEMPDGRRIMIGWMQNWDTVAEKTKGRKIAGQMTLPRELRIRDQKLFQCPVRELMDGVTSREETGIFAKGGVLTLQSETEQGAEMIRLEGSDQRYVLLLDRFSAELFCETTGETRTECFAKQQVERKICLPGLGAGEERLRMERCLIS